MKKRRLLTLILYVLVVVAHATAQHDFIVEHYTKEKGLPSNTVYSTIKDKDGFVWLGTWHGLCSFDGFRFTPFITRNGGKSDMPPRKVRNIVEDGRGYLWIRNTDNHLYVFDKADETYHDVYPYLKHHSRNVQVIKVQLMDNGHVVLLTRSKCLFEAYVDEEKQIVIRQIYDSRRAVDPSTLKLRHNVLGENSKFVYWISKKLVVDVVSKKSAAPVLAKLIDKRSATSFSRMGRYVCIGTAKGGVFVIDTATRGIVGRASIPGHSSVSSISLIEGGLYATTPGGLYACKRGGAPRLVAPQATGIEKVFVDKESKLWMYSVRGLLVCYDPSSSSTQVFTLPTDSLFAETEFVDAGVNGLFVLLRNGEVWRYDHASRIMQSVNGMGLFGSMPEKPNFFDINIDDEGILWLSSATDGVYKLCFPRRGFSFLYAGLLKLPGRVSDNDGVRALYQSGDNDLWVGTRRGDLFRIDIVSGAVKDRFERGEIGVVYHVMKDHEGNLWFSTKGSGLVKGTPDPASPKGLRLTRYAYDPSDHNSISSNKVYYTYQDSHGRIWVCTFQGGLNLMERRGGSIVFRHRRNGFKTYPRYGLYTDVRSITEDRDGRMWVGTTDGLMSFDGKFGNVASIKFETYREQYNTGVADNDIFSMYKDSEGSIWMGIFGNGLSKLERYDGRNHKPVMTTYAINAMQGGDVISAITEDKDHCLWVCTETGIASMKHGTAFLKSYDRFSGFPQVGIEDNTMACLANGKILLGCREGLLSFDPSAVRNENEATYHTFITGMKVVNKELWDFDPPIYSGSIRYAKEIELSHGQSTFTIEFTSPHYTDNSLIPYKYILEGYETQWHESDNNRIASYANVPPGHYRFRVKVDDGHSPERVLEIVITPPWWATWWAYTFYGLLLLAAAYGVMRLAAYMIRMRNEVYINDRLAELKIRFFTNVSHELRTPLSLIKGPIEELANKEKLSPEGKEYLGLIERNAHKMLQLVNQILDFRKVQNGKMSMSVSYVDLTGMVEMLMREFKLLADERNITFTLEKPEERIMAWCDAEKIGVVLNNLISNAFKYTGEGGSICVAMGYDHARRKCTIRVEDDGVGIPKSQLEQIFERFSQASNQVSGDNVPAGTGIGLSLSKEYVAMHHGRIWAENQEGERGVVFTVELPTDRESLKDCGVEICFDDTTAGNGEAADDLQDSETASDAVAAKLQGDVPTIMLIEDNTDMCRMLQLQLGGNYRVFTAHDGEAGMEGIYKHHPDIVITDLMMPGTDGMEVLRRVRHDFSISHIPVIVLTSKSTDDDKLKAIKAGANAFITKPFSSDYLMARISQLLDEQRVFQRKMAMQGTLDNRQDSARDEYESHLVKKDIEFVHKIHEVIEKNIKSEDFNIDTIAETIGLSRSAFFKKLKSLTGFAPVDLVKEVRLSKAEHLVGTTDMSITEIAYSVGFRDVSYFGKCFKKKFGVTPKEYRNRLVNGR